MLYSIIKPLLFKLDPEDAHNLIMHYGGLFHSSNYAFSNDIKSSIKSLSAPSPIGLAAGLDKNAQVLNLLSSLGFGILEAGTVTLKEQSGNPRPRIWRYPSELSLRNAMGFPNAGSLAVEQNLKEYHSPSLLGINIGKNKDSTAEESINELGQMVSLFKRADYFTINVSSPNTPGLRALQEPSYLTELFKHLKSKTSKPMFLKIAPDLENNKIEELASLAVDMNLEGIIATNTTIIPEKGAGGISGALLQKKASQVQKTLLEMKTNLNIIGVGGFSCFEDILQFWYQGGAWIQIYTALIYQGPKLIHNLNGDIQKFVTFHKLNDLSTFFGLSLDVRRKMIEEYGKIIR